MATVDHETSGCDGTGVGLALFLALSFLLLFWLVLFIVVDIEMVLRRICYSVAASRHQNLAARGLRFKIKHARDGLGQARFGSSKSTWFQFQQAGAYWQK